MAVVVAVQVQWFLDSFPGLDSALHRSHDINLPVSFLIRSLFIIAALRDVTTDIHHLRVLADILQMFEFAWIIVASERSRLFDELQDVVDERQRVSNIMLIYILNCGVILPGASGLVAPRTE